ncbi:MAG: phosphodiesterase [Armatimonadetes bacterium]|nr:phosphodiesterase [Armatimonadota bacterium]
MSGKRRAMIIGLDCAAPQFVLDAWGEKLPTTHRLMSNGVYGRLTSTIPPITCPAWMCMSTSKDPGQLGLYGFRNRADYSYENLTIANATHVKEPTLWDILGRQGLKSAVIGVPMTYPPRPLNGWMLTCFLTPSLDSQCTYPASLKDEVREVAPNYQVDVKDFRTDDKDKLLQQIYDMTEQHFAFVRHMAQSKDWDFLFMVEMGIDRLYHAFWRYTASDHRLFEPGNKYENVMWEYHKYVDEEMGRLLELVADDTLVLVASDHGAKTMVGGVCINDWLVQQGLLTLKEAPAAPRRMDMKDIVWKKLFKKTSAWGEGGYYGRVMVNVEGREPQGVIKPRQYEDFRKELAAAIEAIPDENGKPIGTKAFRPEDVYREVRNIPPDLIVYFGDLDWRSAGTIGNPSVHIFENDTGPDDANHDQQGLFILYDPQSDERGELQGASLYDVAPTILERMGLPIPEDMIGQPLHA